MGLIDRVSDLRFTRAVERFAQVGGHLNYGRAGAAATATATAARASAHAESLPPVPEAAPMDASANAATGDGGVLAAIGNAMQAGIDAEMAATKPLSVVPFPGLPALRVWDLDVGLPHAHNHPPNLTPPNPVPLPLPSMGPVIPIPILSGATKTLINGVAAARCGDMGLAIWCGGFFPMFEIFLGSSKVWIEGARAARVGVDITKHCTFSSPKPSDPPLGPMIGATIPPASSNVLIGGVPFPSLFSLAIAQAFKGLFKVGGALYRRLSARSYVAKLMRKGRLNVHGHGAPAGWASDVATDLEKMARTRAGRQLLARIDKAGHPIHIVPYGGSHGPLNALAAPHSWDAFMDIPTGLHMPGSGSTIEHAPANWANHPSHAGAAHPAPGTSSDAILFHEMNHATNNAQGANRAYGTTSQHGWDRRWVNHEEYSTVAAENGYRRETGLPERTAYTNPFP